LALGTVSLRGCEPVTVTRLAWSFCQSGLGPDGQITIFFKKYQITIVLRAIRYSMEQACAITSPYDRGTI